MSEVHQTSEERERREHIEPDYSATIHLNLGRHQEKSRAAQASDQRDEAQDRRVPITERGKAGAQASGRAMGLRPEQGIVLGTPRDRTIQTGLHELFAQEEAVTLDMELDDMRELIARNLPSSAKPKKKARAIRKLDFDYNGSPAFGRAFDEHYMQRRDFEVFLLEESDALVLEVPDPTSTSYSRLAGNVAELAYRYARVLPQWQNLMGERRDLARQLRGELFRLARSSHGVFESFLFKVIQKHYGPDRLTQANRVIRDLIARFPNGNGFDFGQNYDVVIEQQAGQATALTIRYEQHSWTISMEDLRQMITERDQLDLQIKNKLERNT